MRRGSSTSSARRAARAVPTARCTTSTRRSCSRSACRRCAARTGFEPAEVDDVIAGNGILAGDHGDDIARLALLLAGWPETVPGMTLNRFCGSGQQAITVAAMGVGSGAPGSGGRRRRRVDVAVEPDRRLGDHRRRQPRLPRRVPDCAAGHLGRPHRHARGLQPRRTSTRSRSRASAGPRSRSTEGRFDRSRHRRSPMPTARSLLDARRAPAAGHDARRPGEAASRVRRAGRRATRTANPHLRRDLRSTRYPSVDHIDHVHHAGNSSGVVDGARGCRRRLGRLGAGARRHATRPDPRHRGDRLRAGHHADRAGPGRRAVPGQGRDDASTTSTCGRSTRRSPRCRSRRCATSSSIPSG